MARKTRAKAAPAPDLITARYLSIDPRTLGFARIYIGAVLLGDLVHRAPEWFLFFADDGLLSSAFAPRAAVRPSLFWFASTHTELALVFAFQALVYLCLTLGLFTRLANVLAFVAWTSMTQRMWIATNFGQSVLSLLLLWTSLLPMGERFGVDALRASLARHPERRARDLAARKAMAVRAPGEAVFSLAALAVMLQIAAIYFFNAAMKYGHTWRDRTAVHYVLHLDEFATPLSALVRDHLPGWLLKALSASTLLVEYSIALGVATPFVWGRRIALAGIVSLHVGFAVFMVLGPFSWACCGFALLLVTREDWELFARTMRRTHRARTVVVDESDARAFRLARLLARLDGFRLLRFEAADGGAALAVRDGAGHTWTGRAALAEAVAALPLGPLVAPLVRSPAGDTLASAAAGLVRLLERFPPWRMLQSRSVAGAANVTREVVTAGLVVVAVSQAASQIKMLRRTFGFERPWIVQRIVRIFPITQGWQLFAPTPSQRTRACIVDAVTADGRHVDPFTGGPPRTRFDGPLSAGGLPEHVLSYLRRQSETDAYYAGMRAWVLRYPERTGRREDTIVRAEAYFLMQNGPRFGTTEPGTPTRLPLWTTWNDEFRKPGPLPPDGTTAAPIEDPPSF